MRSLFISLSFPQTSSNNLPQQIAPFLRRFRSRRAINYWPNSSVRRTGAKLCKPHIFAYKSSVQDGTNIELRSRSLRSRETHSVLRSFVPNCSACVALHFAHNKSCSCPAFRHRKNPAHGPIKRRTCFIRSIKVFIDTTNRGLVITLGFIFTDFGRLRAGTMRREEEV